MNLQPLKENEATKYFLSLKDGDSRVCLFRGEPLVVQKHWTKDETGKRTPKTCPTTDCEYCEKGDHPRTSVRFNVVISEGGKYTAKIYECSKTVYNQLMAVNTEFPIDRNFIKISRKGTTMNDTEYFVTGTKLEAGPDTLADISTVKELPLDPTDPFWNTTEV